MSTLQVANIHLEATGNNRIQYLGTNSYQIVAGGANVASINTSAFAFTGNLVASGGLTATDITATGSMSLGGTLTLTGNSSVTGLILTNGVETVNVSATAATGIMSYRVAGQSVLYYTTNASANFNANVSWSSGTTLNTALSNGQSITISWLVTQGATAYFSNTIYIDGTQVTPKWSGGAAPTAGNASGIDSYVFTIIKTGTNTWAVLGSQTQYK